MGEYEDIKQEYDKVIAEIAEMTGSNKEDIEFELSKAETFGDLLEKPENNKG